MAKEKCCALCDEPTLKDYVTVQSPNEKLVVHAACLGDLVDQQVNSHRRCWGGPSGRGVRYAACNCECKHNDNEGCLACARVLDHIHFDVLMSRAVGFNTNYR